MKNDSLLMLFLYLFGLVCSAGGSLLVRFCDLPPIGLCFYRLLFALPLLLPFVLRSRDRISLRDKGLSLLSGVALAIGLVFWNAAVVRTSLANTNLFGNLWVFITIPCVALLFKEKIPRNFFFGLGLAAVGAVLISYGEQLLGRGEAGNAIGDLLALGSSVGYAAYFLLTYEVRKRCPAMTILFWCTLGGVIVMLPAMLLFEGISYPASLSQTAWVAALSLVSHIVCMGLVSLCLGRLSAYVASVASLSQPLIAAAMGWLVFREHITPIQWLGMALVLTSLYLVQRLENITSPSAGEK